MIASLLRFHLSCVVIIDLALVGLANYLAFWLRFDGIVPDWAMGLFEQTLPLLMVVRLASFKAPSMASVPELTK